MSVHHFFTTFERYSGSVNKMQIRILIRSSRPDPITFSMSSKYTMLQSSALARGEQTAPLSYSAEDRCRVLRGRNSAYQPGQPRCWGGEGQSYTVQNEVYYGTVLGTTAVK